MRIRHFQAVTAVLTTASLGFGQPAPKGGAAYFGDPGNAFNEKTLVPAPAPKPPPPTPKPPPPPPLIACDGLVGPPAILPPVVIPDAAGGLLQPPPPPPPPLWGGGGEVGFNGATGNSELFNIRVGLNATRKAADNILNGDFLYTFARTNSVTTQQQALFNARDEYLFVGTRWSAFASTNIEYDELRAFRFLIGIYGGVGYTVIDDEQYTWRMRAGAGAVRRVGRDGATSEWVPEALLGTDFTWRMDERQSIVGSADYYPRIDDFGQFRVRARVAYQILLDKATCTTLRLGVQDRYDSNPGGTAKRNDLNYYATIGFTY